MLSKLLKGASYAPCQKVLKKIHIVKIAKGPRCQESKGLPKRSKGPRDPCYPSYYEIQVSKSFLEKSTLSKGELFLVIAFPCIVKGQLLEPMNPTL